MRKVLAAVIMIATVLLTGCSAGAENGFRAEDYQIVDRKAFDSAPAMDFGDAEVGDTIAFGSYFQQEYAYEKEPIEWTVLEKKDNRILVISRYGLDYQQYCEDYTPNIFWEESYLRFWLNSYFFEEAFTPEEQSAIPTVKVSTEILVDQADHIGSEFKAGESTEDKVFVLNREEAEKYFDSDESRIAEATPYCSWDAGLRPRWWLRTPANLWLDDPIVKTNTSTVSYDGKLYEEYDESLYSHQANGTCALVRPVLWIKTGQ